MDSTLLAGIFGLVGSIIGGLCSYYGIKKATDDNIRAQQVRIKQEKDLNKKASARIIYIDLFTAIREIIRVRRGDRGAPHNISAARDFSVHIANLSNHLSFEEMVLINKLYGLVEKIRLDIINSSFISSPDEKIRFSSDLLGQELFGDRFAEVAKRTDYRAIDREFLIASMKEDYGRLFNKIKDLAI
ncbi:hypothetical protein [Calderihabitans maritimus]|uniref:Uncharacterized protein n=1 Tax=Calderihabitans maritimus TaxID=1246530 RepID=A0A1Z5HSW6_9FIRM|nr:hypothetical protein [Calderihabitans maritimus]GAW92360.1 hypothetical protein PTH_2143 [Calderihabitans maritimus]